MKRSLMIVWAAAIVCLLVVLAGCGNSGGTSQDGALEGGGTGKVVVLEFSQPG